MTLYLDNPDTDDSLNAELESLRELQLRNNVLVQARRVEEVKVRRLSRYGNQSLDALEDDLRGLFEAAVAVSWSCHPMPDEVSAEALRAGYEPWPEMDGLRCLLDELRRKYRV